ncbi:MAG: hypothetical protein NC124_10505 [Clostridium sp.]|nr:hypothetical protein [Clostridium sp.]
MKELLVFRSAKHPVVKDCINKINNEYKECTIWLCIQEQCINMYLEYDNVKFIVFPNGMFNYEKTVVNKKIVDHLVGKKFDDIYIPYSTQTPNCREIEKIILKIVRKKTAIYYSLNGNINRERIHFSKIKPKRIIEIICKYIDYNVMRIIYIYFAGRRKND